MCWRLSIGTLYLVATPIGNLEDITLRALRILREAPLIAAEDTRHTRKLLTHFAIKARLTAYHEHNKHARLPSLLAALEEGDVALVSDAGTPGVNDPGYELVVAAIDAGIPVVPVPGPSAPVAALIGSGIPTAQWIFLGFLPSRPAERKRFLETWRVVPATLICFEAPHRLRATLEDMHAVLGPRRIAIGRELTKMHEEWVRGTIDDVARHFEAAAPRGEFTLVVQGYEPDGDAPPTAGHAPDPAIEARARLLALRAAGFSASTAAKQVARELKLPRGAVYDLWSTLPPETEYAPASITAV